MGLDTVSRKPDFHRLYPTKEAFAQTHAAIKAAASMPKSAQAPAAIRPPTDIAGILASKRIPSRFSMRALSDAMLKASGSRIVSEHDGLITRILITIPRDTRYPGHLDPLDRRHFRALLEALGKQTHYIILHSPKQRPTIESWLVELGIPLEHAQLVTSPVFDYSIWAQDAYATLRDPSGTVILCEGVSFPRYEDMTIADDIAAQTDIASLQSYLYFQGGNVLGGDSITLMGLDYINRNVSRFRFVSQADVIAAFEELWGTQVLPLGGFLTDYNSKWWREEILSGYGYQPLFHIDMYVTPTGVVGQGGKPIVFLGSPERAKEVIGRWNEAPGADGAEYNSFFAQTEEQLSRHFEVRKLPLWLVYGNLNVPQREPGYYVLTWNNAVVQTRGDVRKVLLPYFADQQDCNNYGVDAGIRQALQEAAEAEWRKLDFEIARMDGLEDLASGLGSVHCITKALERA